MGRDTWDYFCCLGERLRDELVLDQSRIWIDQMITVDVDASVLTDEVMINMWRCILQSILVRQNNVDYSEHPTMYRLMYRMTSRGNFEFRVGSLVKSRQLSLRKKGDPQIWAPCPAFRSGPVWENLSSQTCPDCPDCLHKVLRSSVE